MEECKTEGGVVTKLLYQVNWRESLKDVKQKYSLYSSHFHIKNTLPNV